MFSAEVESVLMSNVGGNYKSQEFLDYATSKIRKLHLSFMPKIEKKV